MPDSVTIGNSSFSLDTMISNLTATATSLQSLVSAFSYMIGLFMIIRGILKYKAFGHGMNQATQPGEAFAPLALITIGSILMYIPSMIDTSMVTIFGTAQPGSPQTILSYSSTISSNANWQKLGEVMITYFQLIGLIAFIRGWMILSRVTGHSGGQETVGKGVTHIVGGILLVNLVSTIQMLATTFGFSTN